MKSILKASEYEKIQQASSIIENAPSSASAILSEAEHIRLDAFKQGHKKGIEEARTESIEHKINLVHESINYLSKLENDVTDLVVSSIRKIISSYEPDELVFQSIKLGLKELIIRDHITVRVPPGHIQLLLSLTSELEETDNEFIDVLFDERLKGNQCVIESEFGIINVDVDIKVSELEAAIKSHINHQLDPVDLHAKSLGLES